MNSGLRITLVVDSVRSKENIGALFRTADAVGVEKILLCGISPLPINRFGNEDGKVLKSALGATHMVPWKHVESSEEAVKQLRKQGYTIVALEQTERSELLGSFTLPALALCNRVALVVGNEIDGVSPWVCAHADYVLSLPMRGKKESLNVTTAAGVALYALRLELVSRPQ